MPAQTATTPLESVTLNHGKRKREDNLPNTPTPGIIDGTSDSNRSTSNPIPDPGISHAIRDICGALLRYDTTPSILNQILGAAQSQKGVDEPTPKRTKLSTSENEATSIVQKVGQGVYTSFDEVLSDVDRAAEQIQDSLAPQSNDSAPLQWKYQPDSLEFDRASAQIQAFKKMLRLFVSHSQHRQLAGVDIKPEKDLPNGAASSVDQGSSHAEEGLIDEHSKAVLTLFGNAQGQHKQLFSSFQKPLPRRLGDDSAQSAHVSAEALVPLRQNGLLGNQIISTKLVPVEARDALLPPKREPRFRELFHPPTSLPNLTPPKPRSSSANRSSDITWTADNNLSQPSRKHGYTTDKLPAGQWLGYDSVSPEPEATSLEAKRRRRDRALSSGEATKGPSEQVRAALVQAREDALFRRVYSSFAPSVDNSSAIVSDEIKNDIWYSRYGESAYDPDGAIDPCLEDNGGPASESAVADEDPEYFKDVVENFEAVEFEIENNTDDLGGVHETLLEISRLLESLQSHQRIRNSQLGANSRVTSTSPVSTLSGTAPNDAENNIYKALRSRLSDLVSRLPPHVVAKAGGEALADLILSKEVLLESRNYQGTMDEDHTARVAAVGASGSGGTTANAARSTLSNKPGSYSGHGRTNSGAVNTSTSAAAVRPNLSKPPLSNWQTPAQSYASQRSATSQSSAYGRTPLNSYANSSRTNGLGTAYPQTPSQPMYQQRAQNVAGPYGGYNQASSQTRTLSSYSSQPTYPAIASRPSSSSYTNITATSGALQRPATQSSGQSPLPQGSPYAPPPTAAMTNGRTQTSRPQTPSTPTVLQAKQHQLPHQSPSAISAPSQAVASSSNGTSAP